MTVALKMSIGQSDGHSLDLSGVGEAHKTKTPMAYCTFRFKWECPGTSLGGNLTQSVATLWIMHRPLVEGPKKERPWGTSRDFNGL